MSLSRSTKQVLGFTLIELLIVVAIIAILAAIAVPNFLEAQTRAKVARVQSDQRTMATALESYAVDFRGYPLSDLGQGNLANLDYVPMSGPTTWKAGQVDHLPYWLNFLTTPTSYLTSLPLDPFAKSVIVAPRTSSLKDRYKYYAGNSLGDGATGANGRFGKRTSWMILSVGPTQAYNSGTATDVCTADYTPKFMNFYRTDPIVFGSAANGQTNVGDQNFLLVSKAWMYGNGQKYVSVCLPYDSTNGTNSNGHVFKTGGLEVEQIPNYPTPAQN